MPLQIDKLSKRNDSGWLVRDVTFEVAEGEIFGLLGRNGSGKTTILQMISGLERPDAGDIRHNGKELSEIDPAFRYFPVTAKKKGLLGIIGGVQTASEDESNEKFKALVEILEKASNYLVLDDPFRGFDEVQKKQIAEKLRRTARASGICVVLASSDHREIFQCCDRVGILHQKELIRCGSLEEVYLDPRKIFAATIFGENNLIQVRRLTSNKKDTPEFFTIEGGHKLLTARPDKSDLGTINQTITLAIRPEHISISFGASFPEDNLLKARITGVQFLGSTTRITLDAGGLELNALVLRLVGLNIGDECVVGLPPDRIRVLKD